jgi:hypothetical protein
MTPTTPEDRRARVDAIKRDWQADPCFELSAVADDFPEFRDELVAFEREHNARAEAEVARKRTARIAARIERRAAAAPADRPALLWAFAEEIAALEDQVAGALHQAGLAHERLDQLGARGADSERH